MDGISKELREVIIYGKKGEENKISVPVHGNTPMKSGLLSYFIKVAGLKEKDL